MLDYAFRRVLWVIPVIVTVAAVTIFLMYRAPGGPWDREKTLPAATMQRLDAKFGLDKPLWLNQEAFAERRAEGVSQSTRLDLGDHRQPVSQLHDRRVPRRSWSVLRLEGRRVRSAIDCPQVPGILKLGIVALIFSIVVGIPLGVLAALRQNTWLDYLALGTSTLGVSVPTFVSGLLLLLLLSSSFGFSPIRGPEEWESWFSPPLFFPESCLGSAPWPSSPA